MFVYDSNFSPGLFTKQTEGCGQTAITTAGTATPPTSTTTAATTTPGCDSGLPPGPLDVRALDPLPSVLSSALPAPPLRLHSPALVGVNLRLLR